MNALKYGTFAAGILEGSERRVDYDKLVEGLQNCMQPEGALEQILVEKLASLLWRLRRLLAAESAEIQKRSEVGNMEELMRSDLGFGSDSKKDRARLIPAGEALDRLIRYEAHLSREFARTLSQLERLQRMRLGLPVPPPVKVEVSQQ